MNRKILVIFMLVLIFVIISLFSISIYNLRTISNLSFEKSPNLSNNINYSSVEATIEEVKVSPNALIAFFKHYNNCGHTVKDTQNVSADIVNMSKNDFCNFYSDWTINKFTSSEIELSKNFSGNCGQHFLVKSDDLGYVNIYNLKDDDSLDLMEKTEISVKYLADYDRNELKSGVVLYGKDNLNAYIENFE